MVAVNHLGCEIAHATTWLSVVLVTIDVSASAALDRKLNLGTSSQERYALVKQRMLAADKPRLYSFLDCGEQLSFTALLADMSLWVWQEM